MRHDWVSYYWGKLSQAGTHFDLNTYYPASRYSDWLRTGRSGDRIPVGARFFSHIQTGPRTHPVSFTMATGSFPGVKRPGRGADHQPPSSAEVMKGWSYTYIHPLGQFRPVTGLLYLYLLSCLRFSSVRRGKALDNIIINCNCLHLHRTLRVGLMCQVSFAPAYSQKFIQHSNTTE
jgi:hypothetical protein